MLLVRANTLAKGHSGVRPLIIDTLLAMLRAGVYPVVPVQGSLGASGDLAPTAHIGLVLIGKGEAFCRGNRISGAEALELLRTARGLGDRVRGLLRVGERLRLGIIRNGQPQTVVATVGQ